MEDVIANEQTVQMAAVASSDPAIDAWLKADARRSMKIGITGLKHMASLSQETYAYSATVTLDGVRAFDASNHGTGGADMYHPLKGYAGPGERSIDGWLKANTPKIEAYDMELDNSLEIVVGDLISDEIGRRVLNRMLSTKILLIDKADGADALFTCKGKPTPEALAQMKAGIAAGRIAGRLVNGDAEAIKIARTLV